VFEDECIKRVTDEKKFEDADSACKPFSLGGVGTIHPVGVHRIKN